MAFISCPVWLIDLSHTDRIKCSVVPLLNLNVLSLPITWIVAQYIDLNSTVVDNPLFTFQLMVCFWLIKSLPDKPHGDVPHSALYHYVSSTYTEIDRDRWSNINGDR